MGKSTNDAVPARIRTRQHPRCELKLDTRLELEDGRSVNFKTSNISQSGFSGHTIEDTPIGSGVELHLPKIGPVAGEVVWQVGAAMGARLNEELSTNDIMALKLDDLTGENGKAAPAAESAPSPDQAASPPGDAPPPDEAPAA